MGERNMGVESRFRGASSVHKHSSITNALAVEPTPVLMAERAGSTASSVGRPGGGAAGKGVGSEAQSGSASERMVVPPGWLMGEMREEGNGVS